MLREDAFFELTRHGAGQYGIFAGVLEVAAVAGFASNVHTTADSHVEALRAQFAANHGSVEEGGVGVPA